MSNNKLSNFDYFDETSEDIFNQFLNSPLEPMEYQAKQQVQNSNNSPSLSFFSQEEQKEVQKLSNQPECDEMQESIFFEDEEFPENMQPLQLFNRPNLSYSQSNNEESLDQGFLSQQLMLGSEEETEKKSPSPLPKKKQRKSRKTQIDSRSQSCLITQNETKNLPKNFAKAILNHIIMNFSEYQELLRQENVSPKAFLSYVKTNKAKVVGLKHIRMMTTDRCEDPEKQVMNRLIRIISFKFYREQTLSYAFSSDKMKNPMLFLKYKHHLQGFLHKPEELYCMKISPHSLEL